MSGRLITFEGIDGSGKSTQARLLLVYLQGLGINVQLVREPGDTVISEAIRKLVLEHKDADFSPRTEAMLFSAARAQLVDEVIAPALDAGATVICDRYSDSTIAYQGYGRELPLAEIITTQKLVTKGLVPAMTLLIDVPLDVARARREESPDDRMEAAGAQLQQKVRDGYLAMAAADSERWLVVDGGKSESEIAGVIESHVKSRFFA